jgi:hypothetical protein
MKRQKRNAFPNRCYCCNIDLTRHKCGKQHGPYKAKKKPYLNGVPQRVPWRGEPV